MSKVFNIYICAVSQFSPALFQVVYPPLQLVMYRMSQKNLQRCKIMVKFFECFGTPCRNIFVSVMVGGGQERTMVTQESVLQKIISTLFMDMITQELKLPELETNNWRRKNDDLT